MNALIIVDAPKRWPLRIPGPEVISARSYLTDPAYASMRDIKVFNLCRSYRYQTLGYYVSLLAAARGQRPLPSVETMQDLRLSPVLRLAGQELNELIQRSLKSIKSETFELSIYFGRNLATRYDRLALAIFNQFPAPFLRVSFEHDGEWTIESIRIIGAGEIPESHRPFVIEQAQRYFARTPRKPKAKKPAKFDMAILFDPQEDMKPSDDGAIRKMCEIGESMGIRCELIQKDSYGRIAEFDALFIRETTGVNHHTYRFARRAAAEGMVVIDEPESIVRCTNKVYLAESLERHRLPTPKTVVFAEDNASTVAEKIGFPCVIKQPDSAFSAGVIKIMSEEEFQSRLEELFERTDLLLAQEFVPTDFDWRIGVLGGEPLYACRYLMARNHWQIVKRDSEGVHEGGWETMAVDDAPRHVVELGVKAAGIIGDGLYGVDLKVLNGKAVVIEVNDNPNLDSGVEDEILGDELYVRLMKHFLTRLEERRNW